MKKTIELDNKELGRILSALRERHRKLEKGVKKWGDNFDPEKGGHMLEGMHDYQALIHKLQGD